MTDNPASTDELLLAHKQDLEVQISQHPSGATVVMLLLNVGCEEHMTEHGRWLAKELTRLLGVEVYTRTLV